MNKYLLTLALSTLSAVTFAQATISPAKKQTQTIAITGATIHVGNGTVIENGTIVFSNGKIVSVTAAGAVPQGGAMEIKAAGKHVYPGFIAPVTNLGLAEFESVKATLDFQEIGNMNPHIRSLIAYNTDSKVPATLRSNGILMAQITPEGGTISGSSSVVQLDAWNWEDAVIRTDDAQHINWPVLPRFRGGFGGGRGGMGAFNPEALQERRNAAIADLDAFFAEAKAYSEAKPDVVNTRLAAMKHIFDGSEKVFITANSQKDIVAAVNFAKKYGITPVIVGGEEAYLVTDFLKENNISVVIKQPHSLPSSLDDDVNMPYKNGAILANAGVNVVVSIEGYWQQRNLPFMAGTVSAWGLDKEKALSTITLNTAKVLGVDKTTGSLEAGKDATLFISVGDALDMKTNNVEKAFIQGRDINLDNLHKQLDRKFSEKYGLKVK
ncbi:amidohydrolase family protein [Pedobacter duraquae]|uniref:Imidazolonepropionase-like amidohydrolase n=1 Tax=Pedobacter duraquae TaxID=425511 RepID=A0A4R6IEF1_9SPHI|nr:amidohydrolase family protein [Pedobacter duraquae]TDO20007.1 imidazolonepropionase-like amidohydrolase [Pedobacter duraquae]